MKKYIWVALLLIIAITILINLFFQDRALIEALKKNKELAIENQYLELNLKASYNDLKHLNGKYDFEAIEIIKGLGSGANCIDIGAHKGTFTKRFLEYCPDGTHFAIEPLPHLYEELKKNFGNKVSIFQQAVSNEKGKATFNYVLSNEGLSGLKKRKSSEALNIKEIEVDLELLDNLIPDSVDIDFIKIDVEGAEFLVMQGAERILSRDKPIIVFEFGYDSRDLFGATPELVFDFLDGIGYKVSIMEYYLRNKAPFDRQRFIDHFNNGYNYYFVTYPG